MAFSGKVVAKRYWGLTKEEFESLRGTPDHRAFIRQQVGVGFDPSAHKMSDDDYNNAFNRIRVWCENNCSDNYYIQKIGDRNRFVMFCNENDMLAFKLFWDGLSYDSNDPPNV